MLKVDYLKEFTSKLQSLDRSKRTYEVFKDFLILSTCALVQPFYRSDEIEQEYLETANKYTKKQAEDFAKNKYVDMMIEQFSNIETYKR